MGVRHSTLSRYRNMVENWWLFFVLGIMFFAMSLLVLLNPGNGYMAFSVVFAIVVIISGMLNTYMGLYAPSAREKGWFMTSGVIELIIGIVLLFLPVVRLSILPMILGTWLMFRGFISIGIASDLISEGIKKARWLFFWAVLLVVFSLFILINPLFGFGGAVLLLELGLLIAGVNAIVFAFNLRKLRRYRRYDMR